MVNFSKNKESHWVTLETNIGKIILLVSISWRSYKNMAS